MSVPITNLGALQAEFFSLYQAGHYQAALDFLRGDTIHLPNHAPMIAFWEIAVLSLMGLPGEAKARLEAVLDAGYWAHEDGLRSDPDFTALMAEPGIDDLLERMKVARLRDESEIEPLLSIMEPEGTAPPWPLLLALHGDVGSLNDFAPHWVSAAQEGWLVAAPQSIQPSWVSGFFSWEDSARARHQVTHHLHTLRELYSLEEDRIVLAGFSRGGEVTMRAVLDGTVAARGFIGIEGWLFDLDEARRLVEAAGHPRPRCYLVSGQAQTFRQEAQELCDLLQSADIACTVELTDMPHHGFPPNFDAVLRRALDFVLGL